MWPGFDSQTRRHMWVEFVGSILCSERFSPGYSGFPLSSKNLHLIKFDLYEFQFTVFPISVPWRQINLTLIIIMLEFWSVILNLVEGLVLYELYLPIVNSWSILSYMIWALFVFYFQNVFYYSSPNSVKKVILVSIILVRFFNTVRQIRWKR